MDTKNPVPGSSAGLSDRALSSCRGRARFLLSLFKPMSRPLVLLVGLYASMELANPSMPGVFVLDPSQSVDGVSVRRNNGSTADVSSATSDLTPKRKSHPVKLVPPSSAPRAHAQTEWVVELRRAHAPSPGSCDSGEDYSGRDRHRAVNSHQQRGGSGAYAGS
jgi:hypothetical protein